MMLRRKKARHLAGRNFAGAKQGDWEGGKRLGVPHMAGEGVRGLPPHCIRLDSNQHARRHRGRQSADTMKAACECSVVIRFVNHSGH